MSMEIKGVAYDPKFKLTTATYELQHYQGGRGGTCLTLSVELTAGLGRVKARIPDLEPQVDGADPEAALDKLAEWMERAAVALRARGVPQAAFSSSYRPE